MKMIKTAAVAAALCMCLAGCGQTSESTVSEAEKQETSVTAAETEKQTETEAAETEKPAETEAPAETTTEAPSEEQQSYEESRSCAFFAKLKEQDFETGFEEYNSDGALSVTTECRVSGINYYLHTKYEGNPTDKAWLFCDDGKWEIDYTDDTYTETAAPDQLDPALPDGMRRNVEHLLFMLNETDMEYTGTSANADGDMCDHFNCKGSEYVFCYDVDGIAPKYIDNGSRKIVITDFREGCGELYLPDGLTYKEPQGNPATF